MFRSLLLSVVVGCATIVTSPPDNALEKELDRLHIPATLVPKDKHPLLMVRAEGTQNYAAEEKDGKLQWGAASPQATLFDYQTGEECGSHSKGPTWEFGDGSKLTGTLLAKEPAANPSAIPWLLISVKGESKGRLANMTNVQRVDTWGGQPPTAAPSSAKDTKQVRYEATYVFWGDK